MEFFIKKGSTLPILRMELIKDGKLDFRRFFDKLQNSDIYFCMSDVVTGAKKIGMKRASCELVIPENCIEEEYYITYQFTEKETSQAGRFVGTFIINFLDDSGKLIVPIRDTLYVNVLDDGIKK